MHRQRQGPRARRFRLQGLGGDPGHPPHPPGDEAPCRIEPVIGHMKAEHRMGRNDLKGRDGDRANTVLAAAGYNFHLLLRWFEALLRALIRTLLTNPIADQTA